MTRVCAFKGDLMGCGRWVALEAREIVISINFQAAVLMYPIAAAKKSQKVVLFR